MLVSKSLTMLKTGFGPKLMHSTVNTLVYINYEDYWHKKGFFCQPQEIAVTSKSMKKPKRGKGKNRILSLCEAL